MSDPQKELLIEAMKIAGFTAGKMFSKNYWPDASKEKITEKVKIKMKEEYPEMIKRAREAMEVPGMGDIAEKEFKSDCAQVGIDVAKELRDEIEGKEHAKFDKDFC